MSRMTMRQRMLAVVQGREHDRVPFVQYGNIAAPNEEVWSVIGRENMGLLKWCTVHALEHPNCRLEEQAFERDGRQGLLTTLSTPQGQLVQEKFREPTYGTMATHRHFIRDVEDYDILLAYLRDITVVENTEPAVKIIKELGDDGLPHVSVGRTPYQQLWIQWVCLEDLAVHLVECPQVMEEVTSQLADVQRRVFQVVCRAVRELPIAHVNFGDNITAPTIGPPYFRKYCLPMYRELADMLGRTGRDIPVFVHMDGDLQPLWQDIGVSGVRGLDSFSVPPDNDTSVADAVRLWPEMRLWVNFPSSVHLASASEIYSQARRILQEGGHTGRLQIQISENVPPGLWRKSFPQIVKAIRDFGAPGRV